MFTGIITALGRVTSREERGGDLCLHIDASPLLEQGEPGVEGESIAINGVCLTARNWAAGQFQADLSRETLDVTLLGGLQPGAGVNLERALRAGDRLGGHMVSGHVDGVATLVSVEQDARSLRLELAAPEPLARYISRKGSVTLDGVSLTVNSVSGVRFGVNIIPHTAAQTTIGQWRTGMRVHLEVDLVARYLERLLEARNL